MIRYEIYKTGQKDLSYIFECKDGHFRDIYDEVYELLHYGYRLPHEVAAEAADWCDFANVPDFYEADAFCIEVEEV